MVTTGYDFLVALGEVHVVDLFLLAIVLDLPRYLLGFIAVTATATLFEGQPARAAGPAADVSGDLPVSVLLAGHNEESTIERCVRSLHEQSYAGPMEIICVDDGSTDRTYAIMRQLEREGLVQRAVRLDLRGGKAAAINAAAVLATGRIFLVVDCDCSFDRHAVLEMLRPFREDAGVGAVCGNILVRNWQRNLITALQAVEYLITISLGKTLADAIGQVVCVSGAFGAFRREAWEKVGGCDVGPGEDSDLTFRLRLDGFRVRFVRDSICYTDVPETLRAFINQRGRWERDIFWIRFRKYGFTLDPSHQNFRASELLNQLDFLIFTLLPLIVFPIYLLYLALVLPGFAPTILIAVTIALMLLDVLALLLALGIMGRADYWPLLFIAPLFGICQAFGMRLLRLWAYGDELIFSRSLDDNYVPEKVRAWSTWR